MVDNTQSGEDADVKEYSCKKCRIKLFNSDDLDSHNSKQKKFLARDGKMNKGGRQECQSYYLEMKEWM